MRLDIYLTTHGLANSRTRAQSLIGQARVRVDGKPALKSSLDVPPEALVTVIPSESEEFVGRGGIKLASALEQFGLDPTGRVCADIGASTGGFTECLLRRGAAKVYAIDSGTGQLVNALREDARVVSLEGTNARYIDETTLGERVELAVMDVSFISQKLLYPALCAITQPNADIVTLIKPQFEAGRAALGKNGVVKEERTRLAVVEDITYTAAQYGLIRQNLMLSPIKGGSGNVEYLIHLRRSK